MPIIEVNLIPPRTDPEALKRLVLDLFEDVAAIEELELSNRDTTVLLRPDLLEWGIGSELIVFVDGLFQTSKRTQEVIDRLVAAIGVRVENFARNYVPQCTKIEVLNRTYDKKNGFWITNLPGAHPLDEPS